MEFTTVGIMQMIESKIARKGELLKHMLGVDHRKHRRTWGYRNRFYASPGGPEDLLLKEMVTDGTVVGIATVVGDTDVNNLYKATDAGMRLLGFTDAEIARTNED